MAICFILHKTSGKRARVANPVTPRISPLMLVGTLAQTGLSVTWIGLLGLYIAYIIFFSLRFMRPLSLNQVFPSWFVVYVGPAISLVTVPASGRRLQKRKAAIKKLAKAEAMTGFRKSSLTCSNPRIKRPSISIKPILAKHQIP